MAIALTAACSSDDESGSGSGGPTGPIPEDRLPQELSRTMCAALAPCCEEAGIPVTQSTCETTLGSAAAQGFNQADPSLYTYDAAAAGQCITNIRNSTSGVACADFSPDTDISCDQAFTGTLAPGERCTDSIECAIEQPGDSVSCEEGFDTPAVCVVERRAAEGDPCYWTCEEDDATQSCFSSGLDETGVQGQCFRNDGLSCSSDAVCVALAMEGEECSSDNDCTSDTYCPFETSVCTARLGEGDACDSFDGGCADGLYCADSGTCTAQAAAGVPCTDSTECAGSCDNGTCTDDSIFDGIAFICALAAGGFPTTQ